MSTFRLIISSPDGNIFDGDVIRIILRGADGDLAILKDHIPFMTSVQPGKCQIEMPDGEIKNANIESGLLTVAKEAVTLLSSSFKI
ncbi:MAG: F0F1 ATP synthase subunit epsilon [Clostridia bacterium]|nr:F0F1 ATP synthase subunit epsilon [Clostridia bacterium]MBR6646224.1 F0F1 ATP synthase subunit epsilon [Clostridia bacterium]